MGDYTRLGLCHNEYTLVVWHLVFAVHNKTEKERDQIWHGPLPGMSYEMSYECYIKESFLKLNGG